MKRNIRENKILKSSIAISIIVCTGKILGFFKQGVIAWAFGASAGTDIYFAADSYIAMFGQIQVASISPSILTEYIHLSECEKKKELEVLLRKCFVVFPTIALVLILLNIVFASQIAVMLGISYFPEQRNELQRFIISLCPVILFTAFSGVANGILDANEKFVPSKLLSLFFSISIILFVFLLHSQLGVKSMLIGFLVGYGFHTLYVSVLAKQYFSFGKISCKDTSFRRVLKNVFPLVVGNSVVDVGHLVDKIIASSLVTGSVSYLYYGQVISNDLVNAVIITTIGTVLLPSLTKMVANKSEGVVIADRISEILGMVVALLIGIIGLYVVEGADLIRLFFERGSFSSEATIHVTSIAICYAVGFVFIAIREILTKTHYAYRDTATPMKNGIVGVIINTVLSLILSRVIGVSGVALATSISMGAVAFMMCFSIKRHINVFPLNKRFWWSFAKAVISALIMVIIGLFLIDICNGMNFIIRMVVISILMLIIYAVCLLCMRHEAIIDVKEIIFPKTKW